MSSRDIIIAGAGIGGLTAALTLAARGFRTTVLEQAERLDDTGAGVQLSPNASRVLLALGLGEALAPHLLAPEEIRVMAAGSEAPIARIPLGANALQRYGAPYWVVHRGDLQAALTAAAAANPHVTVKLGVTVDDFAVDPGGVTVAARRGDATVDERGVALIGADGLWSALRARLHGAQPPRYGRRTAWRATVSSEGLPARLRDPVVNLWLGRDAHLVHYPVRGGARVNIVAIVGDESPSEGWHREGKRDALRARFPQSAWAAAARTLIDTPEHWLTFALHDRPPLPAWGRGPVTLLGDAAHPMLPFMAQGGAMAIEDAAVLAQMLARKPDASEQALRAYEQARARRSARVQAAARRNGRIYHLGGPAGLARNLALRMMGGERLLGRYDWLYGWRA